MRPTLCEYYAHCERSAAIPQDKSRHAFEKIYMRKHYHIYITSELSSMLYAGKIYIMKVEIAALRSQSDCVAIEFRI